MLKVLEGTVNQGTIWNAPTPGFLMSPNNWDQTNALEAHQHALGLWVLVCTDLNLALGAFLLGFKEVLTVCDLKSWDKICRTDWEGYKMPSDPYIVTENVRSPIAIILIACWGFCLIWFCLGFNSPHFIFILFYFCFALFCFYCGKNNWHEIYPLKCLRTQYSIVNISTVLCNRSLELSHLV